MQKRVPWNKGLKGVQTSWIKGKKHSVASRKKMSESAQGRIPWNKGKKGVQTAWNKGIKMSAEAVENNRKSHLGQIPWCKGKKTGLDPWNKGTKGIMKAWNKGVHTSKTFAGIHYWIKSLKGQPKICDHCGTKEAKSYDWANKDHLYKKKLEDWMRLCRGCHMKYDYKFHNRGKRKDN